MARFRRRNRRQSDAERGPGGSSRLSEASTRQVESTQPPDDRHPETSTNNRNEPHEEPTKLCPDFDEDANDLWSLYGKEAKSYDGARIDALRNDMDGVLIFAGLFSAVLTALVVLKIPDLKVNPADQSAYYQNQTVQLLDRISQQLASPGDQSSINFNPPRPYQTSQSSSSDRRVNIFWLISLIFSLSAALLATLVQQWVRAYMRVFQQSSNPLKTARIRQYLFDGAKSLPTVAEFVPGLIHISLMLFFWGFGDLIFQIDKTVFYTTIVPIIICIGFYIYFVVESIRDPQSPYRTPFSPFIWFIIQKIRQRSPYSRYPNKGDEPISMESRQEYYAMEDNPSRKDRDTRAIQWLVDNINGSNESNKFVLAMPGSFKQEWGRDVWSGVVRVDQSTSQSDLQVQHGLPLASLEGSAVHELCTCVWNFLLYAYNNKGDFKDKEERQWRIRGCVETVAFLVCYTRVNLDRFGKVEKVLSKVLSELGDEEQINTSSTITSDPVFAIRWTCLSLVTIWKMIDANLLQGPAKLALDGFARHTEYGMPDEMALLAIAQRIDGRLMDAWGAVADLHQAFDSESPILSREESDIITILNSREESISKLERIANEAIGVEDVDWRIALLQKRIDEIMHELMQRLPGVSSHKLEFTGPVMISEAFNFPTVGTKPVPPPLIFPEQQIQSLCTLGRRLRDIMEGQNTEMRDETLKSLESLGEIPVSIRVLDYMTERQVWRLLDLRDGYGLGFTIELFFLAVRQLTHTPSTIEVDLEKVYYTGTFKVITSNWERSRGSIGTQRILLDLLCDLVIRCRGVFSDFSYPRYIVDMLLELVAKMVKGHGGSNPHVNEVIEELQDEVDEDFRNPWRMDDNLRSQALAAIQLQGRHLGLPLTAEPEAQNTERSAEV